MDNEPAEVGYFAIERDTSHRLLAEALQTVLEVGGAHLPDALGPRRVADLLKELGDGPFETQPQRYKTAEQYLSSYRMSAPFRDSALVAELASDLTGEVRRSGILGTLDYKPTEASVLRYAPTEQGITPHLDERRFERLVAVYSISGTADFCLVRDRGGDDLIDSWRLEPGSLVLLQAPGFNGCPDGRVLHQVGGSLGDSRVSLAFRMEVPLTDG